MLFPVRFARSTCLLAAAIILSGAIPGSASPASAPPHETDDDSTQATVPPAPDPVAAEFWKAIKLLGSKIPADIERGRLALKSASDLEYTHAQVLLGNCHLAGSYGFPKNPKKAASLFRLAAERGNAFAMVSLGLCFYSGDGERKDEESAINWLTAALAPTADFSRPAPPENFFSSDSSAGTAQDEGLSGNLGEDPAAQSQATAHHLLGLIAQRQKKDTEAQAHFVAAATCGANGRSGIYEAAQQAALNFAFGKGGPRDLAKANEMLDRARQLTARMGVAQVHNYASLKIVDDFAVADLEESINSAGTEMQTTLQSQIAESFADKKSKDYNPAEAVKWYELAADSGQVWAMLSLAFIYSHGDLGQPDLTQAFHWFEKAGGGDKPKHYLATANLGICLEKGLGTVPDHDRAMALFRKQALQDIVCYLGSIGNCPTKIVTYEEALQLNQEWAKKKNDPHAQYLLALRYQNAWGVKPDQKESLKWLKKAAEKKDPQALCDLGLLYEFRRDLLGNISYDTARATAIEYYRAASEAGNIEATANYANMLASGNGIPRDVAKAEELYLKCLVIDPAHPRAHNNLALIYQQRLISSLQQASDAQKLLLVSPNQAAGVNEWREKMLLHFEAAAKQDFPYALSNLGDLYYQGTLVPRDLRRSMGYYEQLTNWPSHRKAAHYQLGLMHEHGEGVPITYTEAAYHYRLAALDGDIEALSHLINFYITGTGVSRDLDRAAFWLQYMARLGQPKALLMLCDIMLNKKEYTQAVDLLKNIATNYEMNPSISGYANERLSLCYDKGYGVKPNPVRAAKYLKIAVDKGNGNALATLAKQQIASGNFVAAVDSYKHAAQSSAVACYTLGQMYFSGTNIAKNPTEGIRYLKLAGERGHDGALYFLANLAAENDPNGPVLEAAIAYAQQAKNLGHTKAPELLEKLEQRRQKMNATPAEDTAKARSS